MNFTLDLKHASVRLMHLNSKTRELWAEKILELANIGAGALIFGQFLSGKEFSFQATSIGVFIIALGLLLSLILLRNK